MKRPVLISLLLILMIAGAKGEAFSDKEKSIIYTNAIKVLESYNLIINQIGESTVKNIENTRSGAESFLELFVNRQVLLYNDLDPAHKLSEFYEAETYSNNLIMWYPDGITINLDLLNARVSEIIPHEENVYSIDIMVKKSVNGNYLNQTLNKNVEELTFRIAFNFKNRAPGNFRIVGIRNAASKYVIDYSQVLKEVNGEDFAPENLDKIKSGIKSLILDYTNFLSLIGDPQEADEDKSHYKESFLTLFNNAETKVYNDIDPQTLTKLVPVKDYLSGFVSGYPEGIKNLSINPDSVKFGKVIKAEDGSFFSYTDARKFFSGNFKGKNVFREMFPLIFKISFKASGNTFSDFLIQGIDISTVNFYEASPGTAENNKPVIAIRPVTRKGLGITLSGSFGQNSINNPDIKSLSLEKNFHNWNVSPVYGFISSIGVSYFFNDNISVRTGLEINKYSSRFNLNGKFTNSVTSTDINSESYNKIVEASYDSVVAINYITLPVLANFTSGKPGKLGFYAEGGFRFSFPLKATYNSSGNYKLSGYYPSHPTVTQYIDYRELGYYSREDIDKTGLTGIKGINIAAYASAGINIPLGYYSSVTAGPEIILGLSDILRNRETYTDIFGKSHTHQPTKIRSVGFRICLKYKL